MFINNFDPVAIEIFSFEIRWYSLAYIFGILIGWWLGKRIIIKRFKSLNFNFDIKEFDNIADRLAKATEARITIVLTNGQVVGDSALNIAEVEKIENHSFLANVIKFLKEGYKESDLFAYKYLDYLTLHK